MEPFSIFLGFVLPSLIEAGVEAAGLGMEASATKRANKLEAKQWEKAFAFEKERTAQEHTIDRQEIAQSDMSRFEEILNRGPELRKSLVSMLSGRQG